MNATEHTTPSTNDVPIQANETQARVRLLDDLPTAEDAFGPHAAIAEAMARLIESEPGGKAIALEGGWGSGKSSVVQMLRERLRRGETKTTVHVFDAWAHEGDPLRRAFLEDLTGVCIDALEPKRRDYWKRRAKSEIKGLERTTDQTSVPVLRSSWPVLVLALASLYPIAIVSLGAVLRMAHSEWPHWWWFLVGFLSLIAAAPALVLAGIFLYCWWTNTAERLTRAGQLISLWSKTIDEHTNTTAHETVGPSSIEFQAYFSDLLAEYLDTKADRRLVLVMDNLDRVPSETARALWSTLRLFADSCERHRNGWGDRVWLLVPYDPSATTRIWDGETEAATEDDDDADPPTPVRPVAPGLAAAFLDKSFQIRFDVPPLLLTEWRGFLITLLKHAFQPVPETIAHKVYLLSSNLAEDKRRPPTPRHLKRYVNDIGALKLRFQEAFPLHHLALYAILRRTVDDIRHWLLSEPDARNKYERLLDDNSITESLCAIAHGTTDVERARALLLSQPIRASLRDGDRKTFERLMKVPGFWEELERVCHAGVGNLERIETCVANILALVEETDLLHAEVPEVDSLRGFLADLVRKADWHGLTEDTGTTAARAIRLNLGTDVVADILRRLASVPTSEAIEKIDTSEWLAGVETISTAMAGPNHSGSEDARIQIACSPNAIPLLAAIFNFSQLSRQQTAAILKLHGADGVFLKTMAPEQGAEWSDEHARALRLLVLEGGSAAKWKPVLDAAATRLRVNAELSPAEITRLVAFATELEQRHSGLVRVAMKSLGQDNILFRRLKNFENQLDSRESAAMVRWTVLARDLSTAVPSPPTAAAGLALAQAMVADPQNYPTLAPEFIEHCCGTDANATLHHLLANAPTTSALIRSVLDGLRERGQLAKVLSAGPFTEDYKWLSIACPPIDDLCKELLQTADFQESLNSVDVMDEFLDGHECLVRSGAMGRSSEYARNIQQLFDDIAQDRWRKAMADADGLLSLLSAICEQNDSFQVGGELSDAIESALGGVLEGADFRRPGAWENVCAVVPANQLNTIASRLIERADHPDRQLIRIIPFLEAQLLTAATKYDKESFVRNAWGPLIKSGDLTGIEWSLKLANGNPMFWKETSDDDRETFRQVLVQAIEGTDEERGLQLLALGAALKLPLKGVAPEGPDGQ